MDPKPRKEISDDEAIKKALDGLPTTSRIQYDQVNSLFVMEILCGETVVDSFSAQEPQKVVAWQVKYYPNSDFEFGIYGPSKFLTNISERRRRNIIKMYANMRETRRRRAEAREKAAKRREEAKEAGLPWLTPERFWS